MGRLARFFNIFHPKVKENGVEQRVLVMAQVAAGFVLQNRYYVDELLSADQIMHPLAGCRMRHFAHQCQSFGRKSYHEAGESEILLAPRSSAPGCVDDAFS